MNIIIIAVASLIYGAFMGLQEQTQPFWLRMILSTCAGVGMVGMILNLNVKKAQKFPPLNGINGLLKILRDKEAVGILFATLLTFAFLMALRLDLDGWRRILLAGCASGGLALGTYCVTIKFRAGDSQPREENERKG